MLLRRNCVNWEDASQDEYIRTTLTKLGRFVLAGQEVTPLKSIGHYVMPTNFHHLVTEVKALTTFMGTPTLSKSQLWH